MDQVGAPEVVDHGGVPVGSASLDLSAVEGRVLVAVVSGIEKRVGNAQLGEILDRLPAVDLLARHDYYYCYCCCCRRCLSQTVVDGAAAVAYPVDDRTESRNFSLVDCTARVRLLQPVPVLVGTPDVEEP